MRSIALPAAVAILLALGPAHAQQQELSPEQQAAAALGQQIGLLSHENAVLRGQLARAQARVQALEAAAKPPAPAAPK